MVAVPDEYSDSESGSESESEDRKIKLIPEKHVEGFKEVDRSLSIKAIKRKTCQKMGLSVSGKRKH